MSKYLKTRFSGRAVRVCNDAAAAAATPAPAAPAAAPAGPIDPATVQILDASGRPASPANAGLALVPGGSEHPSVRNASAALATVVQQRLTTFMVGLRSDPVDDLVTFLCPMVPAGLKFDYLVSKEVNNLATVDSDAVGQNGLPGVMVFDPESTVSGVLAFRGMETPLPQTDRDAADAVPGWSARQEEERRITRLRNAVLRGKAQRILAAAAAAAGGASSQTWDSTADPIQLLKADIQTVADAIGSRDMVRILFGSTAWLYLCRHGKIAGGANYPYMITTLQRIADLLELPVANLKVSYHQAITSKQGVTAAKGRIFTAAEAYIFGCSAAPTLDDPSFLKCFYMNLNGQAMAAYQWQPHPFVTNLGIAYYELVKATNTSAVVRRTYVES